MSTKMKKHEIIKYAYENYPKGTKFKGAGSNREFVSNGSFVFGVDVVDYVINGHNPNSLLNDPLGLVHDADTGVWATIVTEEKPKELEIGKWYKNNTYKGSVVFKCNEISGYGTFTDIWGDYWLCSSEKSWNLATNEEILEVLKKEAIKRGFVAGVTVNSLVKGFSGTIDNLDYFYNEEYNQLWVCGNNGDNNFLIFKDGEWAEIVEQPKEKYYAIMKGVQDSYYTTEILNTEEEVMRTVDKLSKRDNSSLHSINQFPINN